MGAGVVGGDGAVAAVAKEDAAHVVVVDGMFDAAPLVAELRKGTANPPTVVLYFHENQLTTPAADGDRDVSNNTHWHYGAANWRSILAADVVLFNSHTHLQQFAEALPRMINRNSPRECVGWQLDKAAELLASRCGVLHNGVALRELHTLARAPVAKADGGNADAAKAAAQSQKREATDGGMADPSTKRKGKGKANPKDGVWSSEEDQQLLELVAKVGPKQWKEVASHFEAGSAGASSSKTEKQCRTRHNFLKRGGPRKQDVQPAVQGASASAASLASEAGNAAAASSDADAGNGDSVPVILWNARLEDDKDPAAFIAALESLRDQLGAEAAADAPPQLAFRLVVLGSDYTKDQRWYAAFKSTFGAELLFCGFCTSRVEYARWLTRADILVSTAKHETFGVAVVESCYCGVLPLLPTRLSYPELLDPAAFPAHFYDGSAENLVSKLSALVALVSGSTRTRTSTSGATDAAASSHHPRTEKEDGSSKRGGGKGGGGEEDGKGGAAAAAAARIHAAVARFDWQQMAQHYDAVFDALGKGEPLPPSARPQGAALAQAGAGSAVGLVVPPTPLQDVHLQEVNGAALGGVASAPLEAADDARVVMYRPKSLRDHSLYHAKRSELRLAGHDPAVHGGRRAMTRMLEACREGRLIHPLSFLCTAQLRDEVLTAARMAACPDVPIYIVEKPVMDVIRGQNVNAGDAILSLMSFPITMPLADVLAAPPVVVLDDVRNSENLGSILRTAFCLGITSVVASPTAWAALKDTRAARCSMGTMFHCRYHLATEPLADVAAKIKQHGIKVYGAEIGEGSVPVHSHGADDGWCLVLGNEDHGISQEMRAACDELVMIPQASGDSFNVGHAAAMCMYELGKGTAASRVHDTKGACA